MAAPSDTVWGSIVGSYGRVGIHISLTNTNTQTKRVATLWFWSKYSVSDSSNTLYYDTGTTNATTSKGSVSISTTVASGSGWSTSNQVKLASYTYTYDRTTSDQSKSCAMKLSGIDRVGGAMTAYKAYTIPKLASYKVTFNANGGSGAPGAQTKYYGKNLALSSTKPTKSGYTFMGWGTSASTTTVSYAAGATYSANSAITLYAIWRKTITVTFNANGGSSTPAAVTGYAYNSATSVNIKMASGPAKSGYTFLGWSTSSTATSATYASGTSYTFSGSVTLYAVWRKTITVTYNANGGSGAPGVSTGYAYPYVVNEFNSANSTSIKMGNAPTKSGYSFLGWSTSSTATSATYAAGSSYTFSSSVTVYAIWRKTITITYNANGGTGAPEVQTQYAYNNATSSTFTLSATKPTRTDYNFLGWSIYSDATAATYASSASVTISSNMTLYAVWELAHVKPDIYGITAFRCDASGNAMDDGTFVSIKASAKTEGSPKTFTYKYYINDTEYSETPLWAVVGNTSLGGSFKYDISPKTYILGTTLASNGVGPFSEAQQYAITIYAEDEYTSNTVTVFIESLNLAIDIKENAVAIGKVATEDNLFDVDYKAKFRDVIYDRFGEEIGNGLATQIDTDPDTTNQHLILTTNNTPSGKYMYIVTNFYGTKAASTVETCSRMQIAYPYHYAGAIFYRYYFFHNKAWSSWYTLASNAEGSKVNLLSTGSSWISGKTISNASIGVSTQQSSSSYHPYMAIKSSSGHVWNIGGLGNNIGIYGYYSGTTANQTDWSTYWDTSNGNLIHNQSIYLGNNDILYGTNTAGTRLEAMNLCSASNNLTVGYGGYANNTGASYFYGNSVHIYSKGWSHLWSKTWCEAGLYTKNGAGYIYGRTTDGVDRSILGVSSSNNVFLGYSPGTGTDNTNIYSGARIRLYHQCGDSYAGHVLEIYREQSGSFRSILSPVDNGGIYLGATSKRYNTAFFTNAITASDLKEKAVIEDFDFKTEDFIMSLKPIAYTRTGEHDGGKRIHIGFGAQTVAETIKDLDLGNLAMVQASIVYEDGEDSDGNVIIKEAPYKGEEIDDEKLQWGLNYTEIIPQLVKHNQEQQKSINTLQNKVSEQDEIIKSQDEIIKSQDERIAKLESLVQQLLDK